MAAVGGTTFGWMNGADSHTGTDYHPDTTSYDYDAPIDEAGNPRYKYALIAKAIADEVPGARVHAVELDEPAHAWAQRNLAGTGVDLRRGDMADAFGDLAGTVVLVGVPTPDMKVPDIPLIDVFGRGGALKSSWYGDCLPSRDFPMLVDLYQQGRLDLDAFVTEEIGLGDVDGPLECPAGSAQADCAALAWPSVCVQTFICPAPPDASPVAADAGPIGPGSPGGCCAVAPSAAQMAGGLFLTALVGLAITRRRRR